MKLSDTHDALAEASIDRLIDILGNINQHWTRRSVALSRFLQMDDPLAGGAVNRIIQAENKHTILREAAIAGVSEKKSSEAIEALVIALNTGSKHVRCLAATALGVMGNQQAVGPFIAALDSIEQHIDVRCSAVTALGKLGGVRAAEALIGVLKDRKASEKLRYTAPYSLVEPGIVNKDAIEILRRAAITVDYSHLVRASAVNALARLADLYVDNLTKPQVKY